MPKTGRPIKDLTGKKFGRLLVLGFSHFTPGKYFQNSFWECQCDCGVVKTVSRKTLTSGHAKSCGCLWKEKISAGTNVIHGDCRGKTASEYYRWNAMKQRCYNPNDGGFRLYGARGITVCDRWRQSYAAFIEDMGRCPEGHLLDRIDYNGNYEPTNCRWASPKEHARNTARNRTATYRGKTLTLAEWAERFGTTGGRVRWFLEQGKTMKEIEMKFKK